MDRDREQAALGMTLGRSKKQWVDLHQQSMSRPRWSVPTHTNTH